MPVFRLGEADRLLGVSDDTLRRWADVGRFASTTTESGRVRRGCRRAWLEPGVLAVASVKSTSVVTLPQPPRDGLARSSLAKQSKT